jgi:hypothetical protein
LLIWADPRDKFGFLRESCKLYILLWSFNKRDNSALLLRLCLGDVDFDLLSINDIQIQFLYNVIMIKNKVLLPQAKVTFTYFGPLVFLPLHTFKWPIYFNPQYTWCGLFQKRVVSTKLNIYVFIRIPMNRFSVYYNSTCFN